MKLSNALLLSLLLLPAARAQEASQVQARLVAGVTSVQPGKTLRVGLLLSAPEKWHTYWRNPEDAGFPTTVKWKLPDGWKAGDLQWAAPHEYDLSGVVMYGYGGETMLFADLDVPAGAPAGDATISGKVKWLECDDSACVPGAASVTLTLPVKADAPAPSPDAALMTSHEASLPADPAGWTFTQVRGPASIKVTVTPPAGVSGTVAKARFFPYVKGVVTAGADQKWTWGNPATFELPLQANAEALKIPAVLEGVLVSETGWPGLPPERKAVAVSIRPAGEGKAAAAAPAAANPAAPKAAAAPKKSGLVGAILGGLLGGLILNLMPCVFPVLSLKVMGFVEAAHGEKGKALEHALVFAGGVLVMFWALAGLLLALKAQGEQLGWGFQLQNPKVVIGLAVLFTLMALNLFGVFELGESLTGVGSNLTAKGGWGGSFFSGVLAVIVATPCSAAFLGAAGGYALTQASTMEAMTIFTAVAIGMALPYIVLTSSPAMMKLVPRPGEWMVTFKQVMGFFMLATVVYTLFIYGKMRKEDGMVRLITGLLIVGFGAWVYGRLAASHQPTLKRRISAVLAVLLVAGGTVVGASLPKDHGWTPWTPTLAAELRAKGQPFFIDFTAAWCASCQINKKVALHVEEVEKAFVTSGVRKLVADWTDENPEITRALAEYNRASVPMYLLYGKDPAAPPQILPETLTPGIVLDALKKL